jgi:outer membrane immunogenic protein
MSADGLAAHLARQWRVEMPRILPSTLAPVVLAATVSVAGAADIYRRPPAPPPPPPPAPVYAPVPYYNWTGFYVGLNGGGAWGSSSSFDFPGGPSVPVDVSGWLAGGTLGFNYQVGPVVLGIEGDIDASGIRGSSACPGGFACQIRNDWLGTARGRIGYAFNQFLPYLTGGLAVGNLNATIPGLGSSSNTNTGWTIGAGVEVALTRNWSLKAEYLYVDLGSFDCTGCGAAAPPGVGLTTNVVRGGVNSRF